MSDLRDGAAAPEAPRWLDVPDAPLTGTGAAVPESRAYKLKCLLLGPPIPSDQQHSERLGKPVALAVLSSDVMSSCAYSTESILRILVPAAGAAAFTLVTPVSLVILVVLAIICLCYGQVVKAYPVSGGSYVVSRENFGYTAAQIPAAALLCSYTLTVAVSVAAGVDALISAFPALSPYPVEISLGCIAVLTYVNLRGLREAGRIFAVPTYWFLASLGVLIALGFARYALGGHLPRFALHGAGHIGAGAPGGGLLLGVSAFIFLRAFANGASAMTGMEAISNAVSIFREPQVKNARTTLVLMASILGAMFLSVSILAALTHAVPFVSGTPTVLSEIGRAVFGSTTLGNVPYYSLQFSTALILILGANTSFNGFPLLVSFIAQDAFLPRPLTTRGHRLVYSNGILVLAAASVALLAVTRAQVASLIPLYACTVFTGFTMAGAGMTRYHLKRRSPESRRQLVVSVGAFVASAIVTAIFVVTEFTRGAWLVVIAIPLIVWLLARTHRRYEAEAGVLAEDLAEPPPAEPALRRHHVAVLVDRVDLAAARALQLAHSFAAAGGEVRAVHFRVDSVRAAKIAHYWRQPGLAHIPLDVVECPDRRVVRAAVELAAGLAGDGQTEVTLVLPRRVRRGVTSRLLHDRTADRIVEGVNQLPHVSATIAPFDVAGLLRERLEPRPALAARPASGGVAPAPAVPAAAPEATGADKPDYAYRKRTAIAGTVQSVRVQPWSGISALECTVVGERGAILVVFLGRRAIAGIEPGAVIEVEGMVGRQRDRLAMINPLYRFLEER